MTEKAKSAPLDPIIADRLLDLLSSDDIYRARFQQDPRAALEMIGYESPTPGQMTACGLVSKAQPEALIDCKTVRLASKEVIAGARSAIKAMLTSGLSQTTPQLDTAVTSSRFTLK